MPEQSPPLPDRPLTADDEFFIGWLITPRRQAHFLFLAVAVIFVAVAALAATLPLAQQAAGEGAWETEAEVTIDGVLHAEPYALLRTFNPHRPSEVRTLLLVEQGKFGALERAAPLSGQYVQATGVFLHRHDRWMLELSPQANSLKAARPPEHANWRRLEFPTHTTSSPITLRGEIVDPKCYMGAMRPGGGKTHKACAALCISGGVPPMLVTRNAAQEEVFYLLLAADGGSARDLALNYVGDFAELRGEKEFWDDLPVLRLRPNGLRRL